MGSIEQASDPAARLTPRDLHIFAQCIWWVANDSQLPDNEQARSLKWQDQSAEWVRMAAEVLRHLDYNGFSIDGPESLPEED